VEIPDRIRFDDDTVACRYDPDWARRFFRALVQADRLLKEFRGGFIGKCSPVHFFWGAFDLAVTRFSGRPVPPGAGPKDPVNREAYSHEVVSHGFWPGGAWAGGGVFESPVFYSYTVPEPAGFRQAAVRPAQAYFDEQLGEFLLPYDDVRAAASPRAMLLDFMESTYEAGATLARWDRNALER